MCEVMVALSKAEGGDVSLLFSRKLKGGEELGD